MAFTRQREYFFLRELIEMAHIYSVSNLRLDFVRQTATSIKNQNVLSFEGQTMNVPARLFRMTLRSLLIWLAPCRVFSENVFGHPSNSKMLSWDIWVKIFWAFQRVWLHQADTKKRKRNEKKKKIINKTKCTRLCWTCVKGRYPETSRLDVRVQKGNTRIVMKEIVLGNLGP